MSVYMTPATFSLDRLLIIRKINCPLNEELSRQLSVQMRTTMTVARFVSQASNKNNGWAKVTWMNTSKYPSLCPALIQWPHTCHRSYPEHPGSLKSVLKNQISAPPDHTTHPPLSYVTCKIIWQQNTITCYTDVQIPLFCSLAFAFFVTHLKPGPRLIPPVWYIWMFIYIDSENG